MKSSMKNAAKVSCIILMCSGAASAQNAQNIINSYSCPPAQQKVVLTLGVDDAFRPGTEEVMPRIELETAPTIVTFQTNHESQYPGNDISTNKYDQDRNNSYFIDSFRDVPRPVSSASFITRLNNGGGNDAIILGKGDKTWSTVNSQRHVNGQTISAAGSAAGWNVTGNVYVADLALLNMVSGAGTLLDFVNGDVSGSSAREFDVIIQDDTNIDFAALMLCREAH